jgi:hypothetical protein
MKSRIFSALGEQCNSLATAAYADAFGDRAGTLKTEDSGRFGLARILSVLFFSEFYEHPYTTIA